MSEYCMIETASDNKEEINNIAKQLLNKKLVASCHIIESDSSWNWNSEREEAKEYLLQMKTTKSNQYEIFNIIKELHSYECFEFAVYDITSINKDYLNWIDKNIKENNMKLIIKESSWSGRSANYQPVETQKEYEIRLNEKYIIKTSKYSHMVEGKLITEECEDLSFEILEANDKYIKIHTYQEFSNNDNGILNLRTDKMDFIVALDKPLKLTTPTLDFGYIYTFYLVN